MSRGFRGSRCPCLQLAIVLAEEARQSTWLSTMSEAASYCCMYCCIADALNSTAHLLHTAADDDAAMLQMAGASLKCSHPTH
jgi:hypothetical protein